MTSCFPTFRLSYSICHLCWLECSDVKLSVILPCLNFMWLYRPDRWFFVYYCVKVFFPDLQSFTPLIRWCSIFIVDSCTCSFLLTCQSLHYTISLYDVVPLLSHFLLLFQQYLPSHSSNTCTPFNLLVFYLVLFFYSFLDSF